MRDRGNTSVELWKSPVNSDGFHFVQQTKARRNIWGVNGTVTGADVIDLDVQ